MTIQLYSGVPGSGKSLHAANVIRWCLNRRKPMPVLGNFELSQLAPVRSLENFHYYPNEQLRPEVLTDFADAWWREGHRFCEDGIILVIDECQLLFNARNWTNTDRLAWLEFFSQHRKYGYRVILVAQHLKMIDNQFRMLIEYEYQHRKVENLGMFGFFLSLLFGRRLYLHLNFYVPLGDRIGFDWFLARKRDFAMYDSYARFARTD